MKEAATLDEKKMKNYKWRSLNKCCGIQAKGEADRMPVSSDLGSGSISSKERMQGLNTAQESKREQAQYQDAYKQRLHEMYIEIIHKRFQ